MVRQEAWRSHPLRRGPEVFVGQCRGVHFAHNPLGEAALLLLDARASRLIEAADGRPAQAILQALAGGSTEEDHHLVSALEPLLAGGHLRSPVVEPTRSATPPERFFNAWVHITNHCNLACPYCYVAKSSDHMGERVLADVLGTIEATARAKSVERVHVRFAGGEPMLRFSALTKLYEEAKLRCLAHGVRFTGAVITNGTFIPGGAMEWLAKEQVSISLSIDGVFGVQDTMRPVRGGGSSFRLVEESIDRYLAFGLRPYALVTVGRTNLQGLPELVRFLLKKQLGFRLSLVRDFEQGEADLNDQIGADLVRIRGTSAVSGLLRKDVSDELLSVLGRAYDAIEDHVAECARLGAPVVPSFFETHRFCDLELSRPIKKACGAGETYVAIGNEGQVSPCQGALHFPGTAKLDPMKTLPEHARGQGQLLPFARHDGNPECRQCAFRHSCAGGCPLLLHRRDGHVDGRSPYCDVFRGVIPRILGIAALEKRALSGPLGS